MFECMSKQCPFVRHICHHTSMISFFLCLIYICCCPFTLFRWQLRFLQSEFRGQLPKQYSQSTSVIPSDMNDKNEEETSRYVSSSLSYNIIMNVLMSSHPVKYHNNIIISNSAPTCGQYILWLASSYIASPRGIPYPYYLISAPH